MMTSSVRSILLMNLFCGFITGNIITRLQNNNNVVEYEHQKSENSTIPSKTTKVFIEIGKHLGLFFAISGVLIVTSYSLRYLIINWDTVIIYIRAFPRNLWLRFVFLFTSFRGRARS